MQAILLYNINDYSDLDSELEPFCITSDDMNFSLDCNQPENKINIVSWLQSSLNTSRCLKELLINHLQVKETLIKTYIPGVSESDFKLWQLVISLSDKDIHVQISLSNEKRIIIKFEVYFDPDHEFNIKESYPIYFNFLFRVIDTFAI